MEKRGKSIAIYMYPFILNPVEISQNERSFQAIMHMNVCMYVRMYIFAKKQKTIKHQDTINLFNKKRKI